MHQAQLGKLGRNTIGDTTQQTHKSTTHNKKKNFFFSLGENKAADDDQSYTEQYQSFFFFFKQRTSDELQNDKAGMAPARWLGEVKKENNKDKRIFLLL